MRRNFAFIGALGMFLFHGMDRDMFVIDCIPPILPEPIRIQSASWFHGSGWNYAGTGNRRKRKTNMLHVSKQTRQRHKLHA